jgi:Asp-tRNA(Asn)/Glu-tRNA(Gln) amidotransferase A subunit family amidase
MGSVIRPAAYCGIISFKPSFGLINYAGIKPEAASLDTVGVFGRTVDDVALIAAVAAGIRPDAFDGTLPRAPRITVYRGPDWSKVEPAAENVLDAAAQRLAQAGATIEEIGRPAILREALDAHFVIVVYELARAFTHEWVTHRDLMSPSLTDLIEAGLRYSYEEYLSARAVASAARRWIAETFDKTDLWLTASAPGEASKGLESTGDPVLNRVWSLLRLPVVTLPAGQGPNGLPLGVQLIGPYRQDAAFIAAVRWIAANL